MRDCSRPQKGALIVHGQAAFNLHRVDLSIMKYDNFWHWRAFSTRKFGMRNFLRAIVMKVSGIQNVLCSGFHCSEMCNNCLLCSCYRMLHHDYEEITQYRLPNGEAEYDKIDDVGQDLEPQEGQRSVA